MVLNWGYAIIPPPHIPSSPPLLPASAPGIPNWGGLIGRMYKEAKEEADG